MTYRYLIYATSVAIAVSLASCAGDTAIDSSNPDIMARVGTMTLSAEDVCHAVPGGLSQNDSIKFAQAYINNWVEKRLMTEIAADEIDLVEINRMVEDYRIELISSEYRRLMFAGHGNRSIPDDTLKAYYVSHSDELTIERPLVKGVYLKVPDDAANLKILRRLYSSSKSSDIDRLEKETYTAIHYDYFRDRYVDWEQVEKRIPYDFGTSPDAFLRANKIVDFSTGGFTYLLYITEYLPSGSPMPFEFARSIIYERLLTERQREYDSVLRRELLLKAIEEGRAEIRKP